MSWISNLYDTYCACEAVVGVCTEDSQDKMLLPVGHILASPDYIITIYENGTFFTSKKVPIGKMDPRFFISVPCSDDSEGRSGKNARNFPHPLFDQMKYLINSIYSENLKKWTDYLNNKPEYAHAHRLLNAVLTYINNGVLKTDIPKVKEDDFIAFCVNIKDEKENRLWRVPELYKAWIDYQQTCLLSGHQEDICYISGKKLPYTEKHPKSINRFSGNAKLISCNDSKNFTFLGRFDESSQALIVSYEASQKVHQSLCWLIATRAMHCDTQAIFAWAIDSKTEVENPLDDSWGIYESVSNKQIDANNITDLDYGLALRNILLGNGRSDRLKEHNRRIAIMAVDAATTGRLSTTYYRELPEREYHERIAEWHELSRWYQPWNKEGSIKIDYSIAAPSVQRIVKAVLGNKHDNGSESYDKLEKGIRERILHCIIDKEHIPRDILNNSLHRASNPLAIENQNAKTTSMRWHDWNEILCVACGLWRHEKGGEYTLTLEEKRTDRDYLYGRLLAIADRIESAARYRQGNTKDDTRPTNAIRYMTVFAQHPFRTWKVLWDQLNPYIQQLNGANWYLNQISKIMANFQEGEYESNRQLDGSYLMGYFLQRQALQPKLAQENNDGDNENESNE